MDFTNPLVYGVPCFLGLIALEYSYSKSHKKKDLYKKKDLMASLGMGIGSAIIAPLIKTISAIVIFNLVYELFNPMVEGVRTNVMGWESFGYAWYIWIVCQLLDDFSYYWFHRQNHNVRFYGQRILCTIPRIILIWEQPSEMGGLPYYTNPFSICGYRRLVSRPKWWSFVWGLKPYGNFSYTLFISQKWAS